jgi:hypothetical protein
MDIWEKKQISVIVLITKNNLDIAFFKCEFYC